MRSFFRPPVWGLLVLALLLPWVSGCDQGSLEPPEVQDDLFQSYVALGNSITAGFQSGGINDSTQQESYAVLLAEQMGTPFNVPTLANPGCPPPLKPFSEAFPPEPISDEDCALRTASVSSPLHNVAVPQAGVIDVLTNQSPASTPNPLTSFILGGQTQIEAAKKANPTFASVWIGNNDVLGAALAGDTTLATSVDSFKARYSRMVGELESIETLKGAAFVGVADVTLVPHLSRGKQYLENASVLPSNLTLNACEAPSAGGEGDVLVPFPYGVTLLSVAQGLQDLEEEITIDCSQDRTVKQVIQQSVENPNLEEEVLSRPSVRDNQDISLLTSTETTVLINRLSAFNQIIKDQVAEDYAYVDPNALFEANLDRIPAFPNLSGDEPFGPLFSLDGIHPSAETHRLIANALIQEIRATYDVELSDVSTQ